jgi:hypothetical protein
LLIDTNPRFLPLKNKKYFILELHPILYYITPPKKKGYGGYRTNDVEPRALSFLYNIGKSGGCKTPQRIMSFKSHVAFYHIVLNEVLP